MNSVSTQRMLICNGLLSRSGKVPTELLKNGTFGFLIQDDRSAQAVAEAFSDVVNLLEISVFPYSRN